VCLGQNQMDKTQELLDIQQLNDQFKLIIDQVKMALEVLSKEKDVSILNEDRINLCLNEQLKEATK
jgi:hypothetical protein